MIAVVVLCYLSGSFAAVSVWLAEEGTDLLRAVRKHDASWDTWGVLIAAGLCWPMAPYFAAQNVVRAWRAGRASSGGPE